MTDERLLTNILYAYRFRAKLRRLHFLLVILTVFLIVGLSEWAILVGILCPGGGFNCLGVAAYSLFVFQAIAILPPSAARLQDIGWPRFLAVFLSILALLTHPIQMVTSLLNEVGLISTSHYSSGFNLVGSILLLFCLFVLAFVRGDESV